MKCSVILYIDDYDVCVRARVRVCVCQFQN